MIPIWVIKYVLPAIALIGALAGIHHHGVVSGRTASDAKWQPLFIAAEKAAAEANAKNATIESERKATTAAAEARYAATFSDVNARATEAQRRIRALSVRLAAASGSCGDEVSGISGATSEPHDPTPSEERALRIADSITATARACALDSNRLGQLQQWVRDQAAIRNGPQP